MDEVVGTFLGGCGVGVWGGEGGGGGEDCEGGGGIVGVEGA